MWQKHFRIAERQFRAGKYKTIEGHALKALHFAKLANDQRQIAKSLVLLRLFYMKTNHPNLGQTLQQSVFSAEEAYGANSLELAEELQQLACWLEDVSNFEGMEAALVKRLAIVEAIGASNQHWLVPDALVDLVNFYIDREKFDQAEAFSLRLINMCKQNYGPVSEAVIEEVESYALILEGLGRKDEMAALEPLLNPEEIGEQEWAVLEAAKMLISRAIDATDVGEIFKSLRRALVELAGFIDKEKSLIPLTDPFLELKIYLLRKPLRWLKCNMAHALRFVADSENKQDQLLEAAEYFRENLVESTTLDDQMLLMLTLLDLADYDQTYYAELETLMSEIPLCTAGLYTKALMLFKRHGSTFESRAIMLKALQFNPLVPIISFHPETAASVAHHFAPGCEPEAETYCDNAFYQWADTPGSIEFMADVLRNVSVNDGRRNFERIAPRMLSVG